MFAVLRVSLLALLLNTLGAGLPMADVSVKTVRKIGPWSLLVVRDTIQEIEACQIIIRTRDSSLSFLLTHESRPQLITMASSRRWNYRLREAPFYLAAGNTQDTIADAQYTQGLISHGTGEVAGSLAVLHSLADEDTDVDIYDYRRERIWTIPGDSFSHALTAMEDCAREL